MQTKKIQFSKKKRFQSVLITYRGILIRVHTHPEREKVATVTLLEKHSIDGMKHTQSERQTHTIRSPALRYAHEGQHGRGAPSTDPDSEEDN